METLAKWMEFGTSLGLEGDKLKAFIDEQQCMARDERAEQRELVALQLELEREKNKKREDDIQPGSDRKSDFKVPKLPSFKDTDDMDSYLLRFERYVATQGLEKSRWAVTLSALLTGKALETYCRLDEEDGIDYEKVKAALLKRFQFTAEGYRKKLRAAKPEVGETAAQFVTRIRNYLTRWREMTETSATYEGMMSIMLMEQFLSSCNKEMQLFLKDRKPKDIEEMSEMADRYVESRGGWAFPGVANKVMVKPRFVEGTGKSEEVLSKQTEGKKKFSGNCFLCGKPGHSAKFCYSNRGKVEKVAGLQLQDHYCKFDSVKTRESTGNRVTDKPNYGYGVKDKCSSQTKDNMAAGMVVDRSPDVVRNMTNGSNVKIRGGGTLPVLSIVCGSEVRKMPITSGTVNGKEVEVLRDTGCSTAVVRLDLVEEEQFTGGTKACVLIDGTTKEFPVAHVVIDTPYYAGILEVLCMHNPVYDLILGNLPQIREPSDPDPLWSPTGYKVCAVETRNQRKEAGKQRAPLRVPKPVTDIVSTEELKKEQNEDLTLMPLRKLAESGEVKKSKNGGESMFCCSNGVLYREFTTADKIEKKRQVVVPEKFRKRVLQLAHESILGGHLGAKKCTEKILNNFFWPGMQADTLRYCRSCEACQRSIPKGKVTKVPLGRTPLIDEPFRRVAVDIIGPIVPASQNGNRYILTLVDYATRYPEAVSLKHIDTQTVAEALVDIYSRVGIPREVLSDQGKQFTSDVMKEVSRLLSIRQLTTTPYHPACNGLVEKFNGTLKAMMKKMCEERPKDWDRYVTPLLFAYREAPQESTGFAPFELLYGRVVRGPLAILRELWTGDIDEPETRTTYQYVLDLKERLERTLELAQERLKKSKARYRDYYNRKARLKNLKVGDEVLLLLPTDNNKLMMQWKGPFTVVGRVGHMDYKVDTGHTVKTFHANLLKKFYRREKVAASMCGVLELACAAVIDDGAGERNEEEREGHQDWEEMRKSAELLQMPTLHGSESISDVCFGSELSLEKKNQVKELMNKYSDILTDKPGCTTIGVHEIHLNDPEPVKCRPYPLPHALRENIKKEIQEMMDLGIVEQSTSPYAAPVVIVKKKDGSNRFCCDYRKLNAVTVHDAEPIPDQEEIFAKLVKSTFFSKIDLTRGYWQVPLAEEAKPLTAFITPDGLYQFRTMPFGLVCAPASFSRIMRTLLRGLKGIDNFMDDILVHSTTWEEHMIALEVLFKRLQGANLTAKPSKCIIGTETVQFLGHKVGKGQLQPLPDKLKAIKDAPQPKTKKELRAFLGLAGYYRRFVPNFASIAAPLSDKTRKGEPNNIVWEDAQENAFKTLKEKLIQAPILRLPDLTKPFSLRTDASDNGIGAILLQEHDEEQFPVAYASRKLLLREQRYAVMEKECLAIVWAIQKFETYLYGKEFTIETDHMPLQYIQKSKCTNGRILRWSLALQSYRFRIIAIKGKDNVGADYLSRQTD